jgi:8-oxo-dGTP pyrophosphatase MutT (NUDIX family)
MSDTTAPVTPRDAASLLIVRERNGQSQVLMGKRPAKDRFMPDVFVFPGGRVDPDDARIPVQSELPSREVRRIATGATSRRARMLGVAAVRETFEETGLLIGDRVSGRLRPDLECLEYIARAITPRESPIRYHARFFMARAERVAGRVRSNGELLDLRWVSFEQASKLPIISVTQSVLEEAQYRLSRKPFRGVPLFFYRNGALQRRYQFERD